MHEATIAESILKIASKKFKDTPYALRVLKIHVIAGEFRNVDRDSLEFAFDSLKSCFDGTDTCTLELEIIQARALCRAEQHPYHPEYERAYRCHLCGSGIGKLLCGEELDVVNMNLEAVAKEQGEHARVCG